VGEASGATDEKAKDLLLAAEALKHQSSQARTAVETFLGKVREQAA